MFVNTLLWLVRKSYLKLFIQLINNWSILIAFICVLSEKWLFCKTSWYLVLTKIFWMPTLPIKWLQSQYIVHWCLEIGLQPWFNWNESNDNFQFLGMGQKLPPVLLRIKVALLNKHLNQNNTINNLFINIKTWSTFVKLVENSALKKTILSIMWRNVSFPCNRGILFWLFPFFCLSLVL